MRTLRSPKDITQSLERATCQHPSHPLQGRPPCRKQMLQAFSARNAGEYAESIATSRESQLVVQGSIGILDEDPDVESRPLG